MFSENACPLGSCDGIRVFEAGVGGDPEMPSRGVANPGTECPEKGRMGRQAPGGPCEDGGRVGGEVATSQGSLEPPHVGPGRKGPPPEPRDKRFSDWLTATSSAPPALWIRSISGDAAGTGHCRDNLKAGWIRPGPTDRGKRVRLQTRLRGPGSQSPEPAGAEQGPQRRPPGTATRCSRPAAAPRPLDGCRASLEGRACGLPSLLPGLCPSPTWAILPGTPSASGAGCGEGVRCPRAGPSAAWQRRPCAGPGAAARWMCSSAQWAP